MQTLRKLLIAATPAAEETGRRRAEAGQPKGFAS